MRLNMLFRTVVFGLTGILSITGALAGQTISKEMHISPAEVRIDDSGEKGKVVLSGGGRGFSAGEPDLPIRTMHMLVPQGLRASEATLVPLETQVIGTVKDFAEVVLGTEAAGPAPIKKEILEGGWFPENPLTGFSSGRMRGQPLAGLAFSPLQWNPATGEVRLITRFRVEVNTESHQGGLTVERESKQGADSFNRAVRGLLGKTNTLAVAPFEAKVNSGEPHHPTFRPTVDGGVVDMVIITAADQASEYQRLADFKNLMGIRTEVRDLDWVRANYPEGVDLQETVRMFITDAVSKWGTTYILLGADHEVLPVRYGFSSSYGGEFIPADLYYSDLDGNWDADGDGTFGEGWVTPVLSGDQLDLYPDVWTGRLPSANPAQAQVMIDKTLAYQETPLLNGYHDDVLILAEVLFPSDWTLGETIFTDGAIYGEDLVVRLNANHNAVRMYENYTNWPGSLPEQKTDVVDSLNAGFHIVQHIGHGYINTMSVGLDKKELKSADVDALTNGNETGLLYAVNCTSCAIDFACIGEAWLTNPNGGSVMVIGATRFDFPATAALYQDEFYDQVLQNGTTRVGEAFALSKIPRVPNSGFDNSDRWTQFSLICLSDPSIDFFTKSPEPMTVTHAPTYTLGTGTFFVDVDSSGAPLENATVTLFKDGDAYSTGTTDSLGQVTLDFTPDETGTFDIGVFAHDMVPYTGSATVVAPGGAPHIFASDQNLDDDNAGSSNGNNNGTADSGEQIEWGLVIKNTGGITETGITATLSTSDPFVSVSDNLAFYPDVSSGNSVSPTDVFGVVVSDDAPDRHEAHFTFTVFGAADSYVEDVILYIHSPIFEYRHQSVRDSVGNGNSNGTVEANEDFVIIPTLRNMGLGLSKNTEVRLRSTDPAVTIVDSVCVLGDMAAGAIVSNPSDPLQAKMSDVATYHELRIVVVDDVGERYTQLIDVVPPVDQPANVIGAGSETSIAISWDAVPDSTIWGYNVYCSPTQGGPYVRVNDNTRFSAYFNDEELPPLTRFYYQVAAVDSSGNEGSRSSEIDATTTLPMHVNFPVITSSASVSGVTLADLDTDGYLEIVAGADELIALTSDGLDFYDGDQDVRTLGPISLSGKALFWNTPAVGDIDNDGVVELAAMGWNDDKLWIFDAQGNLEAGWPKSVDPDMGASGPLGAVIFADYDKDGMMEVFAQCSDKLFGWEANGTEITDGDSDPLTDGVMLETGFIWDYGTPCVADLNGNGQMEIAAAMRDDKLHVLDSTGTLLPGFPVAIGGDPATAPAIADLGGDGIQEIIFATSGDNQLHAFRPDGSESSGFPVGIAQGEDTDSAPAIGDINGDGDPDIAIAGSNGTLWAFNGDNGSVLPNFPINLTDAFGGIAVVNGHPVLVDIDGDGVLDILVGDRSGRLHGYSTNGSQLTGFPVQTSGVIQNAPAVWDVDADGLTEVVVQSFDSRIYMFDTPWSFDPSKAPWPMFHKNQRNSGVFDDNIFGVTGTPLEELGPGAALRQNMPNPVLSSSTRIQYKVPRSGGLQHVRLDIFDVNGRLVKTLVNGEQPSGVHEQTWNGLNTGGKPVAAGIYPYRLQVGNEVITRKMTVLR